MMRMRSIEVRGQSRVASLRRAYPSIDAYSMRRHMNCGPLLV